MQSEFQYVWGSDPRHSDETDSHQEQMYNRCHLCRASLGTNSLVTHMPVGRKLAYDGQRGRLWVVCRRCGEWNLTPVEERWEALAECEALFAKAEARASSGSVGIARLPGLELLRVGDALPDDIANVRYGDRLRRRRRRTLLLRGGVVGVGVALTGGLIAASVSVGSLYIGAYSALLGTVLAVRLSGTVGPGSTLRFRDGDGRRIRLPRSLVNRITLQREEERRGHHELTLTVYLEEPRTTYTQRRRRERQEGAMLKYRGKAMLPVLKAVLPWLNWWGGSERELRGAALVVDRAERGREGRVRPAWESVARSAIQHETLGATDSVTRLALEMAVTEALEVRALAREAGSHEDESQRAEEIAAIADDMFLPASITDWIARRRKGES